jgi:multiple sugar transport system ATP-binding protein
VYVTHDQVEAMTLADRVVILNHGRIEQVGTPMEVYAAPVNLFVAGFIGSPAMNMVPAEMMADAYGRACVLAAGATLPLDPRDGLALTPGTKVVLGIRPEDIALVSRGAVAPASIESTVTTVEPLGAEFLLSFTLGAQELMAKIAGRALPNVGDPLCLAFNMSHAHVFDATTGRSLRQPPEASSLNAETR